jgi:hypothetical protein
MALQLPCSSRDRPVSCRTFTSTRKQVVGIAYPQGKHSLAPRPMPLRALNQFTKMIGGRSGGLLRPLAARLWTTGQAAHAVEAPSAPSTGLHTLEVRHQAATVYFSKSTRGAYLCFPDCCEGGTKDSALLCDLPISIFLYTQIP